MRRWLYGLAGAAWLTAGAALAQEAPHKPSPLETQAAEGMTQVLRDDCAAAAGTLKAVYDDPGFAQLEPRFRAAVLEGADLCEARLGHSQAAFALSRRAIQEPEATALAWSLHIDLALNLGRIDDGVTALTTLARRSPALLGDIKEQTVFSAYAYAESLPHADQRRMALLEALDHAGWKPKDPFNDAAGLKLERVRLLLAAHRDADAKAAAEGIVDPTTLIALRADDRFAAVAGPARAVDLVEATRKALVQALLAAGAHKDWLSGPYRIAQLQLRLGQDEAALKTVQAALDNYDDFGASAFADADPSLRRLQGLKAEILSRMGRLDAADGAFAEAAAEDAQGDEGFEEKLAYASYLIDTDRSPLALDLLKAVKTDGLTDNGKAYLAAMRACAYSVTGDRAAMQRELAIVTAPRTPDYGAVLNGLICAGDLDGAAKVYIERLNDPAKRTDALVALQRFKRPPTHGHEDKAWDDDFLKVISRPDVLAAVKANGGHVETIDLFDPGAI
ncbi:MAG TPA: hypothetical protein VG939_20700 [Caulobacteraceae bacterium]|nr:hypothetical protein [Caulobacteraceae bacterium]